MLGSLAEADDAVQECWLRLSRADRSAVENLGRWFDRSRNATGATASSSRSDEQAGFEPVSPVYDNVDRNHFEQRASSL